jgi:predicted dehydrogenase
LCEKPSGVSIKDVTRMNTAITDSNVISSMIFHNRTRKIYKKLKEIVQLGELGELKRIYLENTRYFRTNFYHKSNYWRSSWNGEGGGVLINQGQHILDIFQWIFGIPDSIYAKIPFGKYNEFMVDDEVTMFMDYPNNLSVIFFITTGETPCKEKIEVIGTKAKVIQEGNKLCIWKYGINTDEYRKN